MTPYPLYQIDLTARRVGIEVYLNDFFVDHLDGFRAGFFSFCAHSHLRRGRNVLEIRIGGPDEKTGELKPPAPDAEVKVAYAEYQEGDFPGDGGILHSQFKWQRSQFPDEPLPSRYFHEFEVNWDLGPWNWEVVPPINKEHDRPAFEEAIRACHSAFQSGNGASLLEWFEPYIEDELNAYPARTREWVTGPLMKDIASNVEPGSVVAPLHPQDWALRFCTGDRLVECVDRQGRPLLRADRPDPKGSWALRIFLGWHKGKVRILR